MNFLPFLRAAARFLTLAFLLAFPALSCLAQDKTPRVAVFDPVKGTTESRFKLDLPYLNEVAESLQKAGITVARVTTAQIDDEAAFSAKNFDVLMMPGDAFPKQNATALQQFADGGGVIVALAAQVPFLVATAPQADGTWTMEPKAPNFAWQNGAILNYLGAKFVYNPAMHDAGVKHTPTALLKKYLPEAPTINRKLTSRFVVPFESGGGRIGEFYPLLRSQRVDGADVTPQIYVMKNGKRIAIVVSNEFFTKNSEPELWPLASKTIVALVRLAKDLRANPALLTSDLKIALSQDVSLPEPLRTRLPTGSVEPEGAKPLARWGRFDGASNEFGAPLGVGQSKSLPARSADAQFPRALLPGATLQLAIPSLGGAQTHFLRVRGGFAKTGAALRADVGAQTVWNEAFTSIDAGGSGNYSAPNIADVPAEFHRIVFITPDAAGNTLTLSNPGSEPVYFDAVQIETRSQPAPEMILGLGVGQRASYPGYTSPIPAQTTQGWSAIRATSRLQFVLAPGTPDRMAKVDELLSRQTAMNPHLHLIIEGTPEWAAISPERYKAAGGRPSTTPPDPAKYAAIVEEIVRKYGDKIDAYEIWNEADSQQFYRGSTPEYITLYKTLVPVIKRLDPTAKIITTGMAGFKEAFVADLERAGALQTSDWFGFHPYAGKSPAWDVPFGMIEGALYSRGTGMEIYSNESGFVWTPSEWFTAPPAYNETIQAELLNVAMARLLSNGLAKLNIFHAGGDNHPFGLINEKGQPRAAYAVFADYLPLGQNGGRRLDVSLTGSGDVPLQGIHAAAASHADGSVTVVLNPVQSPFYRREVVLRVPLSKAGAYKASLRQDGQNAPLQIAQKTANGQSFAEVKLPLTSRAVLTLTP